MEEPPLISELSAQVAQSDKRGGVNSPFSTPPKVPERIPQRGAKNDASDALKTVNPFFPFCLPTTNIEHVYSVGVWGTKVSVGKHYEAAQTREKGNALGLTHVKLRLCDTCALLSCA